MIGGWFVLDQRASTLEAMGWDGPFQDAILITSKPAAEIVATIGADCVVARIELRNRSERLTDAHMADARLIAAAPDLLAQLRFAVKLLSAFPVLNNTAQVDAMRAAIARATGGQS